MHLSNATSVAIRMMKWTAITAISHIFPHDRITIEIARIATMKDKPRASRHLDHYLYGNGKDIYIDTNELFREDSGVRSRFYNVVKGQLKNGLIDGEVHVPQWVYTNKDWLYALGGITIGWFMENKSIGAEFVTYYRWHPDERRVTQRIHRAAENLKRYGAKEFSIIGLRFTSSVTKIVTTPVRRSREKSSFYLL